MILVERIDLASGVVTLNASSGVWPCPAPRRERLEAAAAALGARELHVRIESGGREATHLLARDPHAAVAVWPLLAHHAARTPPGVEYAVRLPHRAQVFRGILSYIDLVLHAAGVPASDLAVVRLATYELCVNAVEHGRVLERDPVLEFGFTIEAVAVHGWVRDRCAGFDPVRFRPKPVEQQVREHVRRGHGLRIVQRVVDSIGHVHDGRGNLVSFTRGFEHEVAS